MMRDAARHAIEQRNSATAGRLSGVVATASRQGAEQQHHRRDVHRVRITERVELLPADHRR